MSDLILKRGTVNFLLVKHDNDCPTLLSQRGDDCTCNPEFELANEQRFTEVFVRDRKARRKAEREAEKALRKARKGTA